MDKFSSGYCYKSKYIKHARHKQWSRYMLYVHYMQYTYIRISTSHSKFLWDNLLCFPVVVSPAVEKIRSTTTDDPRIIQVLIPKLISKVAFFHSKVVNFQNYIFLEINYQHLLHNSGPGQGAGHWQRSRFTSVCHLIILNSLHAGYPVNYYLSSIRAQYHSNYWWVQPTGVYYN